MGALYFRRFVAQFGRRMIRRFLWIFVMALAGLTAAQIPLRAETAAAGLTRAVVLENDILYLRASHVGTNLAEEIRSAQGALATTNKIIGTILDLRFADGDDPEAAKAAADLFAAKKLPLAVLTDGETRDAAAQLAELLRHARDGLIFGSATSGTKSRRQFSRTLPSKSARKTSECSWKIPTQRRRRTKPIPRRPPTICCRSWITRPRRIWSARKSRMAMRMEILRRHPRKSSRQNPSFATRFWRGPWI